MVLNYAELLNRLWQGRIKTYKYTRRKAVRKHLQQIEYVGM